MTVLKAIVSLCRAGEEKPIERYKTRVITRACLQAGTGYKMLSVPFVFSMSRFQGPAFRRDKIIVIVTLRETIEGIPDKDYILGNDKFPNL